MFIKLSLPLHIATPNQQLHSHTELLTRETSTTSFPYSRNPELNGVQLIWWAIPPCIFQRQSENVDEPQLGAFVDHFWRLTPLPRSASSISYPSPSLCCSWTHQVHRLIILFNPSSSSFLPSTSWPPCPSPPQITPTARDVCLVIMIKTRITVNSFSGKIKAKLSEHFIHEHQSRW